MPHFCVPRKEQDRVRLISNLRAVGWQLMNAPKMRMLRVADVAKLLWKGAWMAKIDLKDAYHHLPLGPHLRQLCGIKLQEQILQLQGLPFGL